MKITSKEINEKTFEKNFRGYDKDEVTAFLSVLASEWDKMMAEKADLEKQLASSEKEANKLKQVEESLFRTLKTAEDTGALIIEEANIAAEEIMNEAHQNAGSMLNEAQNQSQNLVESAEAKGREIMESLKADISSLVSGYETLLKQRDILIKNLKSLSEGVEDTISESEKSLKKINIHAHTEMIDKLSKANAFSMANILEYQKEEAMVSKTLESKGQGEELAEGSDIQIENNVKEVVLEVSETEIPQDTIEESAESEIEDSQEEPKEKSNKGGGSFFDQLD